MSKNVEVQDTTNIEAVPPPYADNLQPLSKVNSQNDVGNTGSTNDQFTTISCGHIRDYFVWSLINLILGGVVLGLISVLLSHLTRQRINTHRFQRARTLSRITLLYNSFSTFCSLLIITCYIIYLVNHFSSNE